MSDPYCDIPAMGDYLEWLRKNTRVFDKVDEKLSTLLAKKNGCKVKQCYSNCARIAGGSLSYHEGFVLIRIIPLWIEHAFLVDDGGTVVDPTLALTQTGLGVRYIGKKFDRPLLRMAKTGRFDPLLFPDYSTSGKLHGH